MAVMSPRVGWYKWATVPTMYRMTMTTAVVLMYPRFVSQARVLSCFMMPLPVSGLRMTLAEPASLINQ